MFSRFAVACLAVLLTAPPAPAQDEVRIDEPTSEAVARALEWLADRQNSDGSWSDDNYPHNTAITAFALTAMLLAAIGIYGVMSYAVAQRTREIGIRVALGAGTGDVVRLVGEHVILVLSLGLSVGLAGALALTRLLQSQLWGVTPTDPLTFIGSVIVLAAAAVAACILPLRRATGVDAATALRCE